MLLSAIPPDVDYVKPLYDPVYDPLWEVCADLGVPVNSHGGTGLPNYGKYPAAALLFITEVQFYSQRPFVQLLVSGVFERFPKLKFVMTEMGCAWMPPMLRQFDGLLAQIRKTGRTGEMRYTDEHILPKSATEYFHQNCWMGVSQPGPADAAARTRSGSTGSCGGATTRTTRAPDRSRASTCASCSATRDLPSSSRSSPGARPSSTTSTSTRSRPLADKVGPTVAELQQPLTELPEKPNEALLRAARDRRA